MLMFSVQQGTKIKCRQFVMRSRTIYQKNRRCRWHKKVKDYSNARECDEKSFLKEHMMLVNQPSESANTKEVRKKGGIEREQCLWMRWSEFFFLKDKTWCLWSNHANQQGTDEGRQKVKKKKKKKSWMVTLLVNVMMKIFLKDKTWRSWSPARDCWWTHSTTHWQSRSSHSGK